MIVDVDPEEPGPLHDPRCPVLRDPGPVLDPLEGCNCRDAQGRTPRDFLAGVDQVVARYESYAPQLPDELRLIGGA